MAGVEKAGAVYRCQTDPPHHCEQIPFDTSGKKIFHIFFLYKISLSLHTYNDIQISFPQQYVRLLIVMM